MPRDSSSIARASLRLPPGDGALPRDVVLFSTADWDHPFWTNKQHVAAQLAASGFRVLYVESLGLRRPTASSRDLSRMVRRMARALRPPQRVNENLWVASPLAIPWHGSQLARTLNERWLSYWLKRECRRLGFEMPIVWTYNPLVGPLVRSSFETAGTLSISRSLRSKVGLSPSLVGCETVPRELGCSLLVYHCVDDLSAAPHVASSAIRPAEEQLVRTADVVFATSESLRARLAQWNPQATHYLPNVADFDHFSRARREGRLPADLASIPRPRIGFVGAVSAYKVDFDLIAALARSRPSWHWVLIGQVGEGQIHTSIAELRLPNVHLLGPRPYEQLPDYLRGFDVATIPCPANPYTAAMFPMKFFEYLAAGLPVVAANVPALAEFSQTCDLVASPSEFAAAVDRVLGGERTEPDECQRLARQHTWDWRTREMLAILEKAWQSRNVLPAGAADEPPRAKAG